MQLLNCYWPKDLERHIVSGAWRVMQGLDNYIILNELFKGESGKSVLHVIIKSGDKKAYDAMRKWLMRHKARYGVLHNAAPFTKPTCLA